MSFLTYRQIIGRGDRPNEKCDEWGEVDRWK